VSLLSDALAEREPAESGHRVDAALEAAGIEAGHPSLYPARTANG
jgi:hypothetical protein